MAILAVLPTVFSIGTRIFNASNPNDQKRLDAVQRQMQMVLEGGSACAYAQLSCWAGEQDLRGQVQSCGGLSAEEIAKNTPCGFATEVGRNAAKAALIEIGLRRSVARVAGRVTLGALKVGTGSAPAEYGSTLVGQVGVNPWILVGIGVVGFLLLRKR